MKETTKILKENKGELKEPYDFMNPIENKEYVYGQGIQGTKNNLKE